VKKVIGAVLACMIVGGATRASAQVGYPPQQSPFIDVEKTHELTPFFGRLGTKDDPAGVAPRGGTLAGLQYEWRAAGPLHLGTSFMYVNSSRLTLNPSKPVATRSLGVSSEPLYAGDAFLALSLTGARSWYHFMPMVGAGVGLISNTKDQDVGGFKFGTRFAFPWSAGVRWVPGSGHLQLRADMKDWMYTIAYPQSYYISTTGDAPILTAKTRQSRWTNNFAMTVGVSYTFVH
jgi:hypothetical protein